MKLFLFFAIALFPAFSVAQTFPFDLWNEGKIVLEAGDTIKGTIKYSLQDLLQIKHNARLESFTPRKVVYFEIFDTYYKRYRHFYSLPYSSTGGYKSAVFFELLCEGKITVLSREKVEYRTSNYSPFGYGAYSTRLVLVNIYYLLKENGNIEEFTAKRNDWYLLMGNKEDDVRAYVKDNKLDFDRKYEVKQIIDYYNTYFIK